MSRDDPLKKLLTAFDSKEFLVDIHHLLHLDEADMPSERPSDMPILLVPKCINQIFTTESSANDELLEELLKWARPSLHKDDPNTVRATLRTVRSRYAMLRELEAIREIPDEVDSEIEKLVASALPSRARSQSINRRVASMVRQYTTTVLTVAKRTGTAILARGRSLIHSLRSHIAELEIPAKADKLISKKAELGARLLPFKWKGGKATKWFVVIVLATAGLQITAASAAGLLLAFADP